MRLPDRDRESRFGWPAPGGLMPGGHHVESEEVFPVNAALRYTQPARSSLRANVMNIIIPVALLALLTLLVVCDSASAGD